MKKILLVLISVWGISAQAADFSDLKNVSQSQFNDIANDLGAAFSYKALNPGDPLGVIGFDIGAELNLTKIRASDALDKATGWDSSYLPVAKLHANKGLPLDFDVGLSLGKVTGLDGTLTGAEVRWSPLDGNMVLPAVSVRGTYSRLSGVNELDFNSYGVETAISKGFLIFKPYLGLGYIHSTSTPHVAGLQKVKLGQHKTFGGVNVNLGLINYALELDQTGDTKAYGAKIGVRF